MVSQNFKLDLSAKLVPFHDENSVFHLAAVPNVASATRRIQKANTTWKKCGYEEQCVFKNGKGYALDNMACNGELNLDINRVFYADVEFKNVNVEYHDFLDISLFV